ncbi:RidA family protein [Bradyrhizobium sp. NAS80.1]|uniref:RidA family protein n=1 Tax=Bradyrhizobium sp. NAS80.1 TaxID=1680159 RepID=UPI001FDAB44E|nr:RidA family protein [Bradyrhizobium sp. NAS80.1]
MIFVSGMTPRKDGNLLYTGQVVTNATLDTYRPAVELATQNALRAAESELTAGERISSVLSLTVYINGPTDYTRHSEIADFATSYIESRIPGARAPARTAVGGGLLAWKRGC